MLIRQRWVNWILFVITLHLYFPFSFFIDADNLCFYLNGQSHYFYSYKEEQLIALINLNLRAGLYSSLIWWAETVKVFCMSWTPRYKLDMVGKLCIRTMVLSSINWFYKTNVTLMITLFASYWHEFGIIGYCIISNITLVCVGSLTISNAIMYFLL